MNKSTLTHQLLISLGAMMVITPVANAQSRYDADQHVEIIKKRCSSLSDASEVIGCFQGDVTVIEQVRRRERQELIQKHQVKQQASARTDFGFDQGSHQEAVKSTPKKIARAEKPDPVETEVEFKPVLAEKSPTPDSKKATPQAKPVAVNPSVHDTPVAVDVNPASDDAKIEGEKTPPAQRKSGLEGFADIFKDTRESTNVIDLTKPAAPEVAKPTAPALVKPAPIAVKPAPVVSQPAPSITKAEIKSIPGIVITDEKAPSPIQAQPQDLGKPYIGQGVTQIPKTQQDDGKLCHSGGDGAGYHCHDAVTPLDKPKRDEVAEEAATKAAEEQAKASGNKCENWQSPMRGSHRITDCIGSSRQGSRRHAGIDLGNGQKPNTAIYSVAPGKVIQAGWMGGYGCVIQVQHDKCPGPIQAYPNFASDKCVSFYAHLQKVGGGKCPMAGKAGTSVDSCTRIGTMGGTGGNYAKHLHFEMRLRKQSGVRLNPLVALGKEIRGASTTPGACKGSDGWLAATGQGHKTHSVGGTKTASKTSNRK